jgi:hypothetical protein
VDGDHGWVSWMGGNDGGNPRVTSPVLYIHMYIHGCSSCSRPRWKEIVSLDVVARTEVMLGVPSGGLTWLAGQGRAEPGQGGQHREQGRINKNDNTYR